MIPTGRRLEHETAAVSAELDGGIYVSKLASIKMRRQGLKELTSVRSQGEGKGRDGDASELQDNIAVL